MNENEIKKIESEIKKLNIRKSVFLYAIDILATYGKRVDIVVEHAKTHYDEAEAAVYRSILKEADEDVGREIIIELIKYCKRLELGCDSFIERLYLVANDNLSFLESLDRFFNKKTTLQLIKYYKKQRLSLVNIIDKRPFLIHVDRKETLDIFNYYTKKEQNSSDFNKLLSQFSHNFNKVDTLMAIKYYKEKHWDCHDIISKQSHNLDDKKIVKDLIEYYKQEKFDCSDIIYNCHWAFDHEMTDDIIEHHAKCDFSGAAILAHLDEYLPTSIAYLLKEAELLHGCDY